jgi:hypothetical protein
MTMDVVKEVFLRNQFTLCIEGGKITAGNAVEQIEKPFAYSKEKMERFFKLNGFEKPYRRENEWKYRTDRMEHHAIPYMAYAYYVFVFEKGRCPNLDEFIARYFKQFVVEAGDGKFRFQDKYDGGENFEFSREELVGRLSRAYNSYNRELHLLLSLQEYEGFSVRYDFNEDIFGGIDIVVTRNDGKCFGIASYVDTRRSNEWKEDVKNVRRHEYTVDMIDMKASLKERSDSVLCLNGIDLYSKSFVDSIVRERIMAS